MGCSGSKSTADNNPDTSNGNNEQQPESSQVRQHEGGTVETERIADVAAGKEETTVKQPDNSIENNEQQQPEFSQVFAPEPVRGIATSERVADTATQREGTAVNQPDVEYSNLQTNAAQTKNSESFAKIEETFWSKKRKLIPDVTRFERLDKHALQVRKKTIKLKLLSTTKDVII